MKFLRFVFKGLLTCNLFQPVIFYASARTIAMWITDRMDDAPILSIIHTICKYWIKEYIPVGCVPSASVTVSPACMPPHLPRMPPPLAIHTPLPHMHPPCHARPPPPRTEVLIYLVELLLVLLALTLLYCFKITEVTAVLTTVWQKLTESSWKKRYSLQWVTCSLFQP